MTSLGRLWTRAARTQDADVSASAQADSEIPVRLSLESPRRTETVPAERMQRIAFQTEPDSIAADRFRFLRMRLTEMWGPDKPRTLVVTSALPGEGKSTTALNLATALAEDSARRVIVIDADLHRASLEEQLGLRAGKGVGECLENGDDPATHIRYVRPLGWHLLPSGSAKLSSPTDLLQRPDAQSLLQNIAPLFDWVVVDAPPVLPISDVLGLIRYADGVLLVTRAGVTSPKAVEQAVSLIGKQRIVGIVLNAIEISDERFRAYYKQRYARP